MTDTLKLLPTSILDIYIVFEKIDMLSIGTWWQPYTVIPPYLAQILWFWVTCGVKMMVEADSHLKLLPTSIFDIYTVFEHINILSIGIQLQPYIAYPQLCSDFVVLGHLWSQNDVIMS